MGETEFKLEEATTSEVHGDRKGGMYCTVSRIVMSLLTVTVLIAATAVLVYYLPTRPVDQVATKPSIVNYPTAADDITPTGRLTTSAESPGNTTTTDLTTTAQQPQPTGAPVTLAPPDDIMKGRLSKTVLPRRYELTLRPFLYDDDVPDSKLGQRFTFDGWVRIKVECMEATDEITLHSKNITIHGMPTVHSVSTLDNTDIFESYKMIEEYSFLVLKLKEMLRPHEGYDIFIRYSGIMATDILLGFYPSKYITSQNETRYIATTQMEGPYARRVLPCFDEPTFKASYDVQLEHRTDMSALSNGIDIRRIQLDSHWSRTYFKRVPSMPTYLLAFVVHDFSSINVTNAHGCLIRIWCETELTDYASYALNVSESIQTYFDDYLDNEFPLDKQDHIAIQEFFFGAMENWGLITYRDITLLYDEAMYGSGRYVALMITHELAHMWFGNLVTMDWWNDLWLNEGFATYMQHIGIDLVLPELKISEQFYANRVSFALYVDGTGVYPSLREPVYATEGDILGQFNGITYEKGGSILWMLEHFLTLDVFNQGIRNYLKERAYKNANAEHLWEELTYADKDVGKHDVKRIMDTWTLQPGYPLITLTRTGQDIVATQKRFMFNFNANRSTEFDDLGHRWYVPLTYVYKSGPSDQFDKPEQVWMEPADQYSYIKLPDEAASDDWYLANAKMVGFYRVNYEDDNWQRLLDQAAVDPSVFPEETKVGLIDLTHYLSIAEVIPRYIYQNFSTYFGPSSPSTRRAVVATSSYFAKMLLRNDTGRSQPASPVQNYMQQLIEPLYAESGWDDSFTPDIQRQRRNKHQFDVTSAACFHSNIHCVDKASSLVKAYMDEEKPITVSPNLRSVVYCNGIRFGGRPEWNYGWEMMQTTTDRQERARWMSALTCSRDSSLLKSYLQTVLEQGLGLDLHRGEAALILIGVAENPAGYQVAWDFIRSNWEGTYELLKGNREISISDVFGEVTSFFNTQEELQELLDFGSSHRLGVLKYAYQAAIIETEVNIRWMVNSAQQTDQWIASIV
ncbi:aminopeptidase N-like [Asterias amurensis]|uniref:aminopeptidase N-like n=1 Tax=Asterias amurensis TaxID=7602 RepID=UPI003AB88C6B